MLIDAIERSGLYHVNNLNIVREPLIHSSSFHTIAIHDYRKEVNPETVCILFTALQVFFKQKI